MELEGGHRNSVIKQRNPIEFGLVCISSRTSITSHARTTQSNMQERPTGRSLASEPRMEEAAVGGRRYMPAWRRGDGAPLARDNWHVPGADILTF
ncbi:hypothetical protein EVAR_34768_1 [Eumeta japonica]|uniref:Uncharacterized protein n=1 Tax=Eumeta variegata TaxID=151549 RepID=A0A4C1ZEY1_EUMVA|nr:hypothetical protein EVAR_34768_1 [Eumeta japonica]